MILSVPEDILVWGCKLSANAQHLSCDLCVDVWLFICLFVLIFGFFPHYWREKGAAERASHMFAGVFLV